MLQTTLGAKAHPSCAAATRARRCGRAGRGPGSRCCTCRRSARGWGRNALNSRDPEKRAVWFSRQKPLAVQVCGTQSALRVWSGPNPDFKPKHGQASRALRICAWRSAISNPSAFAQTLGSMRETIYRTQGDNKKRHIFPASRLRFSVKAGSNRFRVDSRTHCWAQARAACGCIHARRRRSARSGTPGPSAARQGHGFEEEKTLSRSGYPLRVYCRVYCWVCLSAA